MRNTVLGGAFVALIIASPADAQQELPATLAGHAILPAQSFIEAPADAPSDLKTSGKHTTGKRVTEIGMGETGHIAPAE